MTRRLLAAGLYVTSLVTYGLLRGEAFEVPGAAAEIALMVLSSLLLGLAVGRWWAVAAPIAVDAILLTVWANAADDPNRLDLMIYLLIITLPFMLAGTGAGVGANRAVKHFGGSRSA